MCGSVSLDMRKQTLDLGGKRGQRNDTRATVCPFTARSWLYTLQDSHINRRVLWTICRWLGRHWEPFVMTLVCFPVLPSLKISAKRHKILLCSSEIEQVDSNSRICPLLRWGFVMLGEIHSFPSWLLTYWHICPTTGIKKALCFKYYCFIFKA